jgi:RimJ/RimL family protein N-acetyltransferase
MSQQKLEVRTALETERLLLRPFASDDFDAVFAIQSSPDVARWLYWDPRTEAEVRTALEQKIASTSVAVEGDALFLAAIRKDTGELVGDFVLSLISEEHRSGEIGFIVHPEHGGLGFATEAGYVLLRLAFEDLGLHRVFGRTEARNIGSARVMEKLGMRREAHLVENEWVKGEWQSELDYAILDREWRAQAPAR